MVSTTISIPNTTALTCCNAIVDAIDVGSGAAQGKLVIYSGTAPTNVDAALSGNTVLAQLNCSNPAFGAAADIAPGARATAATISDDSSADATGTASFFRFLDRDSTPTVQGSVGATSSGEALEFNTVSFVSGARVQVSSFTITVPES